MGGGDGVLYAPAIRISLATPDSALSPPYACAATAREAHLSGGCVRPSRIDGLVQCASTSQKIDGVIIRHGVFVQLKS